MPQQDRLRREREQHDVREQDRGSVHVDIIAVVGEVPGDHEGTEGGGATAPSSAAPAPAVAFAIDDDRVIIVPSLFVRRRRGGVRPAEGRSRRSDDRDEQQFREGERSHIVLRG